MKLTALVLCGLVAASAQASAEAQAEFSLAVKTCLDGMEKEPEDEKCKNIGKLMGGGMGGGPDGPDEAPSGNSTGPSGPSGPPPFAALCTGAAKECFKPMYAMRKTTMKCIEDIPIPEDFPEAEKMLTMARAQLKTQGDMMKSICTRAGKNGGYCMEKTAEVFQSLMMMGMAGADKKAEFCASVGNMGCCGRVVGKIISTMASAMAGAGGAMDGGADGGADAGGASASGSMNFAAQIKTDCNFDLPQECPGPGMVRKILRTFVSIANAKYAEFQKIKGGAKAKLYAAMRKDIGVALGVDASAITIINVGPAKAAGATGITVEFEVAGSTDAATTALASKIDALDNAAFPTTSEETPPEAKEQPAEPMQSSKPEAKEEVQTGEGEPEPTEAGNSSDAARMAWSLMAAASPAVLAALLA